ncbi:unnamed protein product [Cunninghamella blakesleeana]
MFTNNKKDEEYTTQGICNLFCYDLYDDGIRDGNSTGYSLGYAKGYNDGKARGYTFGYDKGHEVGYQLGYEYGKNEGYHGGYHRAYIEIKIKETIHGFNHPVILTSFLFNFMAVFILFSIFKYDMKKLIHRRNSEEKQYLLNP